MRDWTTVPAGETGEEHITPGQFLAYRREQIGAAAEQRAIQSVTLLTFQQQIADQFVQQTHAVPVGDGFSTQTLAPMWVGTLGGARVTIQRLPIGAPTATVAFELLIAGGAEIFLLAGVAGSLQPTAPIGSVIIPTGALREEGVSYHYLPPDADPQPDPELTEALIAAAEARGITPHQGRVWTTDALFREMGWKVRRYGAAGILAVEMEMAALLAVAQVRGVRLAAAMAISDELYHPWSPGWHVDAFHAGYRAAANLALDVGAAVNDSLRTARGEQAGNGS
jgi:uridine phosphorylase